jgi:hypothetical protein
LQKRKRRTTKGSKRRRGWKREEEWKYEDYEFVDSRIDGRKKRMRRRKRRGGVRHGRRKRGDIFR